MTEPLDTPATADEAGTDAPSGAITFVGSGPADLSFITLAGARALSGADLVLVDDERGADEVRAMAPAHCELAVAGDDQVEVMLGAAARGARVVRLAHGDYYSDVDDSGVLEKVLAEGGLRVNVIPGINRWGAALSFGAVHITNQAVALDAFLAVPDIEDWPSGETMIIRTTGAMAGQLAVEAQKRYGAEGHALRMVNMGTTAQVSEVVSWGEQKACESPEVYYILGPGIEGSLRDRFAWFEGKPLFDWRVVAPSTKDSLEALTDELAQYGASTEIVATMSIEPPRTEQAMEKAMRGLVDGRYHWLIFTSPHAVTAINARLREYGLDSRALSGISLAAVGRGTVEALARLGLVADLVPVVENTTGALANEFPAYDDLIDPLNRVLVPSADVSVEPLLVGLGKLGWEVEEVTAYRTVRAAPPPPEIRDDIKTGMFDAVAFTSATAVRNMIGIAGKPHSATVVAAIGPATAAACEMHGLRVDVVADQPTFESLAEGLAKFANHRREGQIAAGLPTTKPSQRKRRKRRKVIDTSA